MIYDSYLLEAVDYTYVLNRFSGVGECHEPFSAKEGSNLGERVTPTYLDIKSSEIK